MATTALKTKMLKFSQVKLNKLQKQTKTCIVLEQGRPYRATAITQQWTLIKGREYNITDLFFFTIKSYMTVNNIIKTITVVNA